MGRVFVFTQGKDMKQEAIVGKAVLEVIFNNEPVVTESNIVSDQNIQDHKAHWMVTFLGSRFDVYVNENQQGSSTIRMERDFIAGLEQPSKLSVTIFSNSPSQESLIIIGPGTRGDYTFGSRVTLFDETAFSFQKTISIN